MIFNDIYSWFKDKLQILFPDTRFSGINYTDNNSKLTDIFKTLLDAFDTGIKDIIPIDLDFDDVFTDMSESLKIKLLKDLDTVSGVTIDSDGILYTIFKDQNNELKVRKLGLQHSSTSDELFEFEEESDGTQRILDFIPVLDSLIKQDFVIIIDEINRSLHPTLTKKYLIFFSTIALLKVN